MVDAAGYEGMRDELDHRRRALFDSSERQAFLQRCQDVTDFLLPHAGNLFCRDKDRVAERWRYVLDTEASYCLDVATNGLVSYMAPPGGDWLGLIERDPELAESPEVKDWLQKVGDRMLRIFEQSNTYDALRLLKQDCLAFGGGVQIIDDDEIYTLWHHHVQAGEYALAASGRGQIDTVYRELTMTVRQCEQRWGESKLSRETLRRFKEGPKSWDHPVRLMHAIEPRPGAKAEPMEEPQGSLDMPWRSVYWEADTAKSEGVLSESGYRVFPVLASRYATIANGLYGYGPGPMSVPHIKSLQDMQHKLGKNVHWQTDPATVLPASAASQIGRFRPGGHIFSDSPNPESIRAAWENRTNLQHLLMLVDDFRKQIRRIWNIDAWLMFASIDRSNTTAAEIYARRQEKIDILGPQTARLFNESLRPLADIAFSYMQMRGTLPQPIPQVLLQRGAQIDPEFRSVLSQASKSTRMAALEQFTSFAAMVGERDPSVLHTVDTSKLVREHADLTGIPSEIIRSEEKVAEMEAAAAQQAAELQKVAATEQLSKTTKNLATSPMDTPNALTASGGL